MDSEHAADVLLRHGVPVQALGRAHRERPEDGAEPDGRRERRGLEQAVEVGVEIGGAPEAGDARDRPLPEDPQLAQDVEQPGLDGLGRVGLEAGGDDGQHTVGLPRDAQRRERAAREQVFADVVPQLPVLAVGDDRAEHVAEERPEGALPQRVGQPDSVVLRPAVRPGHRSEQVVRRERQPEGAVEKVARGPGDRVRGRTAFRVQRSDEQGVGRGAAGPAGRGDVGRRARGDRRHPIRVGVVREEAPDARGGVGRGEVPVDTEYEELVDAVREAARDLGRGDPHGHPGAFGRVEVDHPARGVLQRRCRRPRRDRRGRGPG